MSSQNVAAILEALFDAERAARQAQDDLVGAEPASVLTALEGATREALNLDEVDEEESALRLVRIAGVLGEMQGPRVADLLIDILGSDEPEARQASGEALSSLAFDRFKEVAQAIERSLERLPQDSPAIPELPYLLVEIGEPGVIKLLGRFLAHPSADAVAAAIESLVEIGDPSALPLLEPLAKDARRVELQDEGGTDGDATIGELVAEARSILAKGSAE